MKVLQKILFFYAAYIFAGSLLLMLPFAHQGGVGISYIDSLFIATSAVSTTGLVSVSIANFTFFGQFVVWAMIFAGGIGYMTFGAFITLSIKGRLSREQRNVLKQTFSIPRDMDVLRMIRHIFIYAVSVKAIGALFLIPVFWNDPRANPIWSAIFHSVSAFDTAGFSLYPDNFVSYMTNVPANIIISIISILGALGFIVAMDFFSVIRHRRRKFTFTTKIILTVFSVLVIGATLINTFSNGIPEIADYGLGMRLMITFFQTVNAINTAGFNSVDLAPISLGMLLILTLLMIVGTAPTGTSGALKIPTLSAVYGSVISHLKGQKEATLFHRVIPAERVKQATSNFVIYISLLVLGIVILSFSDPHIPLHELIFEAASAIGTTGLSTGITGSFSIVGKITLILLMYVGRVGVFTAIAAITIRSRIRQHYESADVAV